MERQISFRGIAKQMLERLIVFLKSRAGTTMTQCNERKELEFVLFALAVIHSLN